jgi:ethanolamine utilization protein EutQ (cupin superfamily)
MTLGDINVPEKGRNSNDTTHNADEAIDLERQHPVDTEPTPKETCERCKMKLEKEAGEMDVQNLGKFLKNVCEREGGNQNECIKIENDYYANQLHDGKNLNLALGRFCNTFFEVPCKDDEENGGKVVRRRLRRRRR